VSALHPFLTSWKDAPHAPSLTHARPHTLPLPQRDGCPKVLNIGAAKADAYYTAKKYGGKAR
jgi:hypothetical protein